jgi:hypothetical protein
VIEESEVYKTIAFPNDGLVRNVQQLRAIRMIDAKKYSSLKRELPYIVCGYFNQPFRRLENFAYIDHFVIDIDHLEEKNLDITAICGQVKCDGRVALCFTSPGSDGLKLMFRLKDRCYDSELYKLFYRAFAHQFSIDYHLEQAIDDRTCDVTRACFLSVDINAYYNPDAVPIDMNDFISNDNVQCVFDLRHELNSLDSLLPEVESLEAMPVDPDETALAFIKQQLSLKKKPIVEDRNIFVPEILQRLIGSIVESIQDTGISVLEVMDIQYGKKIKVMLGARRGEVNVYYGRNGFTVVESPKRGTCEELNNVTADIIYAYVNEPETVLRVASSK